MAEDQLFNQKVMLALLAKKGFDAAVVNNGKEAVEHVSTHPCDIVFLDCKMPVMGGLEASRAIRDLQHKGLLPEGTPEHLPIVAVTGNALDADREKCMESGMDHFISKPIRAEVLYMLLDVILGAQTA